MSQVLSGPLMVAPATTALASTMKSEGGGGEFALRNTRVTSGNKVVKAVFGKCSVRTG